MSVHQQLGVPPLGPGPVFEPTWLIICDPANGIPLIQSSMACASAFHPASSALRTAYQERSTYLCFAKYQISTCCHSDGSCWAPEDQSVKTCYYIFIFIVSFIYSFNRLIRFECINLMWGFSIPPTIKIQQGNSEF